MTFNWAGFAKDRQTEKTETFSEWGYIQAGSPTMLRILWTTTPVKWMGKLGRTLALHRERSVGERSVNGYVLHLTAHYPCYIATTQLNGMIAHIAHSWNYNLPKSWAHGLVSERVPGKIYVIFRPNSNAAEIFGAKNKLSKSFPH